MGLAGLAGCCGSPGPHDLRALCACSSATRLQSSTVRPPTLTSLSIRHTAAMPEKGEAKSAEGRAGAGPGDGHLSPAASEGESGPFTMLFHKH